MNFRFKYISNRLSKVRKAKKLSQNEVGKMVGAHGAVIGRYERGVRTPSVDIAKKLTSFLDTTVGYLLGETEDDDLLKDQDIISRLKNIKDFSKEEKSQVYFTLDAVIREIKNRRTYAIAK